MDNAKFFPTEKLKTTMKEKGIVSYIPEDGCDPDPAWDIVSRNLWPATVERQSHRESLAHQLMYCAHDEVILETCPIAAIIMSRMAQNLMGNKWMNTWFIYNEGVLRQKIRMHRRQVGAEFKLYNWFKKLIRNR